LPKDADWLKQSGAVTQMWSSALLLLSTLNEVFLQENASHEADEANQQLWRARFDRARQRLQHAGIRLTDDLPNSKNSFVECRRRWNDLVYLVGDSMAYEVAEIDAPKQRRKRQFHPGNSFRR
jgi:hypothetical protein